MGSNGHRHPQVTDDSVTGNNDWFIGTPGSPSPLSWNSLGCGPKGPIWVGCYRVHIVTNADGVTGATCPW